MSGIKFMVIGNVGAHDGFVTKVDYGEIWQANANEGGWTFQQVEGAHGTRLGEYDTYVQAKSHLTEWLKCDAADKGRFCYTHNPAA